MNDYDASLIRWWMVRIDDTHDTLAVENLAVDVHLGRGSHGSPGGNCYPWRNACENTAVAKPVAVTEVSVITRTECS